MPKVLTFPTYQFPFTKAADDFLKWCSETYPRVMFTRVDAEHPLDCYISLNPMSVPYNKKGTFFKEVASTYCDFLNRTGPFCPIGKDPTRPSDTWSWSSPRDERIIFVH